MNFFADNRIVKAELRSARKPREEELNRIRAEVRKLYDATEVILNVTVDESLLSGYVLQVATACSITPAVISWTR